MGYAKHPPMPESQRILHLRDWVKTAREHAAHRAGYRCQICHGYTGMNGQADHIIPRRKLAELGRSPWDLSNVQWLCRHCHAVKTNAERWEGHTPLTQKERMARRTKVPGRRLFQVMAGIPLIPPRGAGP